MYSESESDNESQDSDYEMDSDIASVCSTASSHTQQVTEPSFKVFVKNFPPSIKKDDIQTHLKSLGLSDEVRNIRLFYGRNKKSKGCGYIEFTPPSVGRKAIGRINGSLLLGKHKIHAKRFSERKRRQSATQVHEVSGKPASLPPLESGNDLCKVFVGAQGGVLPQSIETVHLKEYFGKFQHTLHEVCIIVNPATKKSKGYGFATFKSKSAAHSAIRKFNGTHLHGCQLKLEFSKKKEDATTPGGTSQMSSHRSSFQNSSEKGSSPKKKEPKVKTHEFVYMAANKDPVTTEYKVFVGGLRNTVESHHLQSHFSEFKTFIVNVYVYIHGAKENRRHGFVVFSSFEVAQKAILSLNGSKLHGAPIRVQHDKNSSKPNPCTTPPVVSAPIEQHLVPLMGKPPSSNTIALSNLNPEIDEDTIKTLCEGTIVNLHIVSVDSNSTKAVITFSSVKDAKKAIDKFNGSVFLGQKVSANYDQPIFQNPLEQARVPCSETSDSLTYPVKITQLAPTVTKENLSKIFETVGEIIECKIFPSTNHYALINFSLEFQADAAVKRFNGMVIDGMKVNVSKKSAFARKVRLPISESQSQAVTVCISNLQSSSPLHELWKCLTGIFSVYQSAKVVDVCPPCAYVKFNAVNEAYSAASALHNSIISGSMVNVTVVIDDHKPLNTPPAVNTEDFQKTIHLSSAECNLLSVINPDGSSLYKQLTQPFETNTNVRIELILHEVTVHFSGQRQAVESAHSHFKENLLKHVPIELECCQALLSIHATLPKQMTDQHGVSLMGLQEGSTLLKLDGPQSGVLNARAAIDGLIASFQKSEVRTQVVLTSRILLSLNKRLKSERIEVFISHAPGSHDAKVYSFLPEHHEKAIKIISSKPSMKYVPCNLSLQQVPLEQICKDLSVSTDMNEPDQKINIRGFFREDVLAAQEKISGYVLSLSVQFTPIKCNPAQIHYLRCKLESQNAETISVLNALPAEVLIAPNRPPHFKGNQVDIEISQKLLLEGPLLHGLRYRTFTFRGQHKFFLQLEQHILKPCKREHSNFEYIREDVEGERVNRKGRRGSTKSEESEFTVTVLSQDSSVFDSIVAELENVTFNVKTLNIMQSNALEYIVANMEVHEHKHRVRIVIPKDSKTRVLIFALTENEATQCLSELKEYIESTIEIEKYIQVDRNQIKYFEQKKKKEWEELKVMCKSFKIFNKHKQETETALIRVEGTVKQVRSVCQQMDSLRELSYFSKVFKVVVEKKFKRMWLKYWDVLIKEKEELHDLIILVGLCNKQSITVESSEINSTIEYKFTICGGDENGSIDIEEDLSTPITTNKVIQLSELAIGELEKGRKEKKLQKIDQYMVHMYIDYKANTVTLTAPIQCSDDLEAAEGEIEQYVGKRTLMEREITVDDPVIGLVLHSKSKSSPHLTLANQLSRPYGVTVQLLRRPRYGLRLRGKQDFLVPVEALIREKVLAQIELMISKMEFPVNSSLLPFFDTPEFVHFSAKIRDELCVLNTFPKSQADNRDIKNVYLKTTTSASCIKLEICTGNLVNENVDAIVNAANEDLQHIGGLAKTILNAGGPAIQNESDIYIQAHGQLKEGDVVCLGAGNLLCKKIIHAVGPRWKGGSSSEEQTLYFTVLSCLQVCQREGFKSVAFPALSTGIFGVPTDVCIRASMKAVRDFCQVTTDSCVTNVRFVLIQKYVAEDFALALDSDVFLGCVLPGTRNFPPSPVVSQNYTWEWMDDDGSFKPYNTRVNLMLNEKFSQSPSGMVTFSIGKHSYIVDLVTMSQTNVITKHQRPIRGTSITSPTTQSLVWKFTNDVGRLTPYLPSDSQAIERMYRSQQPGQLNINGKIYTFDFKQMCQINVESNYKRPISRIDKSPTHDVLPPKQSLEKKDKPVIVTLRGPTANLPLAKQRLKSKLDGALDSGEITFPASLEDKIHTIVQKHKLQFKITSTDDERTEKRHIRFEGLSFSVNKARSSIQEEIINFHVAATESSAAEVPPEWQSQSKNLELYPIHSGSHEWQKVQSNFKITLPTATVHEIKRIQNKWLWERYAQHKQRLAYKNNGNVNEKELFHGTRGNDPKLIYEGEDGFDSRYSSTGMWGLANYFAVNANYSDAYAYTRSDRTKEMFMVKVLTGDSFECAPNQTLRLPPEKTRTSGSGALQFAKVRYDTVTGTTRGSQVFMTYDNDKAYPAYLIHYS